jgi:hypothetical protein
VDAVERRAEIERAGAERIFRTASHVAREVRAARVAKALGRSWSGSAKASARVRSTGATSTVW